MRHEAVWKRFEAIHRCGRWAAAYLLVGDHGIGKRAFAQHLAKALLCLGNSSDSLASCERCASCKQLERSWHPDLVRVAKPADRASLIVELLIGPPENRMQQGFCYDLSMKPTISRRKVAILEDADFLEEEGANALLKTLEEPPPGCVIFLIGSTEHRQLPTIRSRCQIVRFARLSVDEAADLVMAQGIADSKAAALELASQAAGDVQLAAELADPRIAAFKTTLLSRLSAANFEPFALAAEIIAFAEAAGTEASDRRPNLRMAIRFAAEFFRQSMLNIAANPNAASEPTMGDDLDRMVRVVERCLAALAQVDRNVHLATLTESWLDDVAQIQLGQPLRDESLA